jgi:outer membrane lipoprotein SlyB
MAALVWFTMGVAVWHFTVFVPDRFSGGIVGAFVGAAAGALVSGAIAQIAIGQGLGETDLATALYAVPGTLVGLGIVYLIGVRSGVEAEHI